MFPLFNLWRGEYNVINIEILEALVAFLAATLALCSSQLIWVMNMIIDAWEENNFG